MPCNGQGNRIKIQTYYECRRHDTLHSPGCNEGKALITPWGHAYEKEDELRRSGTNSTSAEALALGVSAAPLGLKIC